MILEGKVNDRIQSLYTSRPSAVPHNAAHFFNPPVEQILKIMVVAQKQWMDLVKQAKNKREFMNLGSMLQSNISCKVI